jgi:hypothetical protein
MRKAMEGKCMHAGIYRQQFEHGTRRRITQKNAGQIFTHDF